MEKEKVYIGGVVQSRGVIVFREGNPSRKFLIIQSNLGGHWTFPKGHITPNEKEREAAIREVEEETGISDINIISGFEREECYQSFGEDKCVKFYLGKTAQKEINIDEEEVKDAGWYSFEEAYKKLTYDRSKQSLKEAQDFIESL